MTLPWFLTILSLIAIMAGGFILSTLASYTAVAVSLYICAVILLLIAGFIYLEGKP